MTPRFQFKIYNDTLYPAGIIVNTPIGWEEALIGPERDKDFHSLIEVFDGSFVWFGTGRDVILNLESTLGPDAIARLEISISYGGPFTLLTTQLLDISQLRDLGFHNLQYKCDVPIIRDDFWTTFINRFSTPADVQSTVDKDGNAVAAAVPYTLNLTGQKIKQRYSADATGGAQYPFLLPDNELELGNSVPLGGIFTNVIQNEVEDVLDSKVEQTSNIVDPFFRALFGGDFTFKPVVYVWDGPVFHAVGQLPVYIQKNDDAPIPLTRILVGTDTIFGTSRFVYKYTDTVVLTLDAGDIVRLYMQNVSLESGAEVGIPGAFLVVAGQATKSTITIDANTVYKDTTTQALLIHDAFNAVIRRITGLANSFYSEYLGRITHGYGANGCGSAYALMYGKHVRGFSFTQKPFAPSAEELWQGANPIFNLGLGYDVIGGNKVIRIEPKSFFYSNTKSINLNFVENVQRRWDLDNIYKTFENGYAVSSIISKGGIDDPQGTVLHNSRFSTIGVAFSLLSSWFAASLGIEQARRQQALDNTEDGKIDDSTVIIALKKTDVTFPELDENFDSVTGLNNSSTRYNIRLSAKRCFKRWQNFFAGCLQTGTRKDFYFASGTGNNAMTSKITATDCEGGASLSEKQDVVNNGPHLFTPGVYELDTTLTFAQYQTIIANREKAIGISKTDTGHVTCSIISFKWKPTNNAVKGMLVWIK